MFNPDKLFSKKEETKNKREMSVEEVLKSRIGRNINITKPGNRENKLIGTLEKSTVNDSGFLHEYRVNVGTPEAPEYIEFSASDVESLSWPDPNRPKRGKGGIPRPTFDLK